VSSENSGGEYLAKLPSTIYTKIQDLQRELYASGLTNGSVALGDVYEIFEDCGYKRSTANKWLLNWAICCRLKFEKDKDGYYRIRTGIFEGSPSDMLCGGEVWLPTKEVKFKTSNGVLL